MDLLIATHALACDHTLVSADRAFHSVSQLSLIDWNELPAGND
jgi:predicted nucleic acid-binding protein